MMTTGPGTDDFRRQLVVPTERRVTIAFVPSPETALLTEAVFTCEPCQRPLYWESEKGWWGCAECEMEMTTVEAAVLMDACGKALKRLEGLFREPEKERRRWWHWLLWFGKRSAQST
jgi:hypothetical protein